jgi:hypothetical protein
MGQASLKHLGPDNSPQLHTPAFPGANSQFASVRLFPETLVANRSNFFSKKQDSECCSTSA